jgi:beta-phosphoglucomutase-like phosphatase (HAD superfamily)
MIKAVIFDVDDTLLDNLPNSKEGGLHERSRLAAVKTVGAEQNIESLINVTQEENLLAFTTASANTIESAVWNLLQMKGVVPIGPLNKSNELLVQIIRLKNELYEKILHDFGVEVPGATNFLEFLETIDLADKLAIGSSGIKRDIRIFIDKMEWGRYFPENRIISKEATTHYKPHPEVFELAYKTLKTPTVDKSQVLVMEDDPRGVMAGKAADMQVCAITTRFNRDFFYKLDVAPDYIIDTYEEAKGIFIND